MVEVVALGPFVTILDGGNCVAAVKGDKVMLPKARADELIKAKFARLLSASVAEAPENKRVEAVPENKAAPVAPTPSRSRRSPHTA